ncbi:MAG: hypothetical protein N2449_07460 [Bacteroidales bacterium]|nr:hypothetical protein [Bacteroidales bacterium]
MKTDNKIVHGLWIGSKLSNLELLTIHSFVHFGHEFWLWTYNPIETPLPPSVSIKNAELIIPYEKVFCYKYSNQYGHGKGSYAGFSDIFRYALLYQYGGWWVDMDVTCLKPLDFEQPYVFRKHHQWKVVGNIMKCPAQSTLMKDCYEEALLSINSENKNWDLPIQILNKNIINHGLESYIFDFTNPDQWRVVKTYLKKNVEFPGNYKAIHWVNEEWRRHSIAKHISIKDSKYYELLKKYNINTLNISFLKSIILRFKLSDFYSMLLLLLKPRALLLFMKNFLSNKNKNFY